MKLMMNGKRSSAFTLIEMLVVIGLLGALTALVLPGLAANREEALGDVCDYNQAGSVRVLKQYNNLVGGFPADMHNGLQGTDSGAAAMEGLPSAQTEHMVTNIAETRHALTEDQADSLVAAGITSVCSGTGLNSTPVAENVNVAAACADDGDNAWLDDGGVEMTFDGIAISDWATANGTPS
jgi:prepilin-type N-terminal cleavage/methylation domain-containing protein